MPNLVQLIKQIALETIQSDKPVELIQGSVRSVEPLEVVLDQRLTLTQGQLYKLKGSEVAEGDRVFLMREQKGQKFLILGVLEDDTEQ
jgi:Protein of unknown function (DUF2577).